MGKTKEAAKSLPKRQRKQIKKAVTEAHRSLDRTLPGETVGVDSQWTVPGEIGDGEVSFLQTGRGKTKLLGKRAVVSFEQRSMETHRIRGPKSHDERQLDEASLSIELQPEGSDSIEARFDFLKPPVREMIRLASALPLDPERPLEERVDVARDVLNRAVTAIS